MWKIWIKLAAIVILILSTFQHSHAQPTLDIGLFAKDSATLQVRVRPDAFFNGLFSEVVFTIKYEAGQGTDLGTNLAYPEILRAGLVSPAKAGSDTTIGLFTYQKFQGNGGATLMALGQQWNANDEIIIMEIDVSSAISIRPTDDLTFEIEQNANSLPGFLSFNGGYYAELNALDKTGIVYAFVAGVLEVDWGGLQALKLPEEKVRLEWYTERESGTNHFVIEKRKPAGDFEPLGEVRGTRNSLAPVEYEFIDDTQMAYKNQYRIKQLFPDGSFAYSETVEVDFTLGTDRKFVVYPNPVSDVMTLQVLGGLEADYRYEVTDARGRRIAAGVFSKNLPSGSLDISMEGQPSGVYFVKTTSPLGDNFMNKILKR